MKISTIFRSMSRSAQLAWQSVDETPWYNIVVLKECLCFHGKSWLQDIEGVLEAGFHKLSLDCIIPPASNGAVLRMIWKMVD